MNPCYYIGDSTKGLTYSGNKKEFREELDEPKIDKQFKLLLNELKYHMKNNNKSACKVIVTRLEQLEEKLQ